MPTLDNNSATGVVPPVTWDNNKQSVEIDKEKTHISSRWSSWSITYSHTYVHTHTYRRLWKALYSGVNREKRGHAPRGQTLVQLIKTYKFRSICVLAQIYACTLFKTDYNKRTTQTDLGAVIKNCDIGEHVLIVAVCTGGNSLWSTCYAWRNRQSPSHMSLSVHVHAIQHDKSRY